MCYSINNCETSVIDVPLSKNDDSSATMYPRESFNDRIQNVVECGMKILEFSHSTISCSLLHLFFFFEVPVGKFVFVKMIL